MNKTRFGLRGAGRAAVDNAPREGEQRPGAAAQAAAGRARGVQREVGGLRQRDALVKEEMPKSAERQNGKRQNGKEMTRTEAHARRTDSEASTTARLLSQGIYIYSETTV